MARKGENIFKRKDGRWEARYIHHYENGKAKYGYIYAATYTEAKAKKQAILAMPEFIKPSEIRSKETFEVLTKLWLSDIKISVKESTYAHYMQISEKYLLPKLGSMMICRITVESINLLTQHWLQQGSVRGSGLAPKTVIDILCVLKSIFKYGKENGYSNLNTAGIRYPQRTPHPVGIFPEGSRIQLEKILFQSEDRTSQGILFTLFTGIRIGELCGLQWKDIDFVSQSVTIRRTVVRIRNLDPFAQSKTKVIISEPKTGSSIRTIPMPKFLCDYLQDKKSSQYHYFLSGTKKPMEPHQYYVQYKRWLKEKGLEDHTFHALRHTFATRCIELGFDTKSLAEILGHSSITTTLNVYVHPSMQQKKKQMERLAPVNYSQSI